MQIQETRDLRDRFVALQLTGALHSAFTKLSDELSGLIESRLGVSVCYLMQHAPQTELSEEEAELALRMRSWLIGPLPVEPLRLTGRRPLSLREMQVITHIAQGQLNCEIAQKLRLTKSGVHSHAHRIFKKFGVRDRATLALRLAGYGGWYQGDGRFVPLQRAAT